MVPAACVRSQALSQNSTSATSCGALAGDRRGEHHPPVGRRVRRDRRGGDRHLRVGRDVVAEHQHAGDDTAVEHRHRHHVDRHVERGRRRVDRAPERGDPRAATTRRVRRDREERAGAVVGRRVVLRAVVGRLHDTPRLAPARPLATTGGVYVIDSVMPSSVTVGLFAVPRRGEEHAHAPVDLGRRVQTAREVHRVGSQSGVLGQVRTRRTPRCRTASRSRWTRSSSWCCVSLCVTDSVTLLMVDPAGI